MICSLQIDLRLCNEPAHACLQVGYNQSVQHGFKAINKTQRTVRFDLYASDRTDVKCVRCTHTHNHRDSSAVWPVPPQTC